MFDYSEVAIAAAVVVILIALILREMALSVKHEIEREQAEAHAETDPAKILQQYNHCAKSLSNRPGAGVITGIEPPVQH